MCGDSASVSTNVVIVIENWMCEARYTSTNGRSRTSGTTATSTVAASTDCGRWESRKPNGRKSRTTSPVIRPLAVVRAPASRLSALRENDAPTGNPPNTPAARFATPWLRNSRFAFQGLRSSVAYVRAIEDASTKPISAITSAGTSSSGSECSGSESVSGGRPACTLPTSAPP